jgi:hypothetical protein
MRLRPGGKHSRSLKMSPTPEGSFDMVISREAVTDFLEQQADRPRFADIIPPLPG